MVEDKIISLFDSVLGEIIEIETSFESELSFTILKEISYRLNTLSNGLSSDLDLLKDYSIFFDNEDFDHGYVYAAINRIIFKYKLRQRFEYIGHRESHERKKYKGVLSLVFAIGRNFEQNGNLDFDKTKDLIKSWSEPDDAKKYILNSLDFVLKKLLEKIVDPLYYHTNIKPLEEYEDLEPKNISNIEMKYYKSWVDCSVTLSDWKRYTYYNFRAYLRLHNFDFKELEAIELHQTKLFNEEVKRKTESLINDIVELNDKRKIAETRKMHIFLLEKFFSGNADSFTIERLKVLHRFHHPKKVLLHYDEILKSDYFDYDEMHIFQPKKNRQNSSLFSACVLFEYHMKLKNLDLSKEKTKTDRLIKSTKSFAFINEDFTFLKNKLIQVNLLLDLFTKEEMFEDFCSLLQSDDFTVDKFELIINCETIQFSYLIRKLQPYFKNLRPVNLEKCGSFFTKTNGLKHLKQGDIKTIPAGGVKLNAEIDKIFN